MPLWLFPGELSAHEHKTPPICVCLYRRRSMLWDYEPANHFPVVSVLRATAICFVSMPLMQDLCLDDPTAVLHQVPALWLRLLVLYPDPIRGHHRNQ